MLRAAVVEAPRTHRYVRKLRAVSGECARVGLPGRAVACGGLRVQAAHLFPSLVPDRQDLMIMNLSGICRAEWGGRQPRSILRTSIVRGAGVPGHRPNQRTKALAVDDPAAVLGCRGAAAEAPGPSSRERSTAKWG